jgi:hypothetical protein
MRTIERLAKAAAVMAVVAVLSAPPADAGIAVEGGTRTHHEMARWAIGRFEAEGFTLPDMEVRFHLDRTGCRDRMGYYADDAVDLCYVHLDLMASRTLLHEMAHGWLEANLTTADRERFLRLRALDTWNDDRADWDARGYEQAAEILAWGLGDQRNDWLPMFPNNSRHELVVAYEMLTGRELPRLDPSMTWEGRPTVSGGVVSSS